MVTCSNRDDKKETQTYLREKQPYVFNVIDEVNVDPRCNQAHLFCILFCSFALKMADRISGVYIRSFSEDLFRSVKYEIALKNPMIGKRAYTFPDRIQRHVLCGLGFDTDDSFWLILSISAFLGRDGE